MRATALSRSTLKSHVALFWKVPSHLAFPQAHIAMLPLEGGVGNLLQWNKCFVPLENLPAAYPCALLQDLSTPLSLVNMGRGSGGILQWSKAPPTLPPVHRVARGGGGQEFQDFLGPIFSPRYWFQRYTALGIQFWVLLFPLNILAGRLVAQWYTHGLQKFQSQASALQNPRKVSDGR